MPGGDPLAKILYAPELVMSHQEAIGLTDRQRAAIVDAMKEMQSKALVETQFKLSAAGEKLQSSLARSSVDEAAVLQQIDEMLTLEREVKRAQMTLLVRIKNQLTAEQRAQLDKLR
jgi:Spy/CpxP family protein refolding chaperone